MLVFLGRMRFTFDGVTAATQLVDDATEAMTDTAGKFFSRMVGAVPQNGQKFLSLSDSFVEGCGTSRHRDKVKNNTN